MRSKTAETMDEILISDEKTDLKRSLWHWK